MDKQVHQKADDLKSKIEKAEKRIESFKRICTMPPGQLQLRNVHISFVGDTVDVIGECLVSISKQISETLSNELSELEKQYKEL